MKKVEREKSYIRRNNRKAVPFTSMPQHNINNPQLSQRTVLFLDKRDLSNFVFMPANSDLHSKEG
jgi:hypothetical protein